MVLPVTATASFNALITAQVAPPLAAAGFTQTETTFHRRAASGWQVIACAPSDASPEAAGEPSVTAAGEPPADTASQAASDDAPLVIELGVTFDRLAPEGAEHAPPIEACHMRSRLNDLAEVSGASGASETSGATGAEAVAQNALLAALEPVAFDWLEVRSSGAHVRLLGRHSSWEQVLVLDLATQTAQVARITQPDWELAQGVWDVLGGQLVACYPVDGELIVSVAGEQRVVWRPSAPADATVGWERLGPDGDEARFSVLQGGETVVSVQYERSPLSRQASLEADETPGISAHDFDVALFIRDVVADDEWAAKLAQG